ncbi:hypothetical protein C2R22_17660 [Salinigranum rubrum]|uniref:Uncharacterized protein n=1 Tax=Salinigranum rubrum TaxID=755307 RepID=A0A2I8VMT4_9EURY|nr:hypothetical protein [Salinigranum rubrum]AUV83242.1 hypothetical protein C2R22_17660 [Salinigranum rubrum]
MSKTTLLKVTLAVHAVLAALVAADARKRDRPVGKWVAATLLTGVVAVLVYVLSGGDDEAVPLDELVDQIELE